MKIKEETFENKRVFITGGNGFLGRALIKELLEAGVSKIIIYSRDEVKHFRTKRDFPSEQITHVIGDVRDYKRLSESMRGADIAIHAAALKRINDIEENVHEGIKTNVLGTQNFAQACLENNIPLNLFVSTDKACSPSNAYGATKYLGEKIFSQYAQHNAGKFLCVRYGNVMSSTGSVIPIFQEQIRKGGPITLTDERMTRFFMLPIQAVELIFIALSNPINGAVYLPTLSSFKVTDLIEVLKKTEEKENLSTETIGLRPGEKIHEELINQVESRMTYEIGHFFVILSQLNLDYSVEEHELIGTGKKIEEGYKSSKDFLMDVPGLDYMMKNYLMGGEQ